MNILNYVFDFFIKKIVVILMYLLFYFWWQNSFLFLINGHGFQFLIEKEKKKVKKRNSFFITKDTINFL
jgi:hypothetical protein